MISQLEPNFEQENLYEINFKINHSNLKGLEIKRTIWNIRQYYHCSGTIQKISNVQTQARLYGELNNVIFAYYDLTETFMKNNNVQIENVQPVEIINSKEETNGKVVIIKTANEFSTGKKSSGYEESSENINMKELRNEMKVLRNEIKKKDEELKEKDQIIHKQELENLKSLFKKNE